MKRLIATAVIMMLLCFSLAACAPSDGFPGTYVKVGDTATWTVTLSSNGSFKYVRKLKSNHRQYKDPVYDTDTYNVRKGSYKYSKDDESQIEITVSYNDPATGKPYIVKAMAMLQKTGGKIYLNILGDEFDGVYTKK